MATKYFKLAAAGGCTKAQEYLNYGEQTTNLPYQDLEKNAESTEEFGTFSESSQSSDEEAQSASTQKGLKTFGLFPINNPVPQNTPSSIYLQSQDSVSSRTQYKLR